MERGLIFYKICPYYLNAKMLEGFSCLILLLNEIFEFAPHYRIDTRNNFSKIKNPFRKTNIRQKTIYCTGLEHLA